MKPSRVRLGPLAEVPEKATAMASTAKEVDMSASSQRTARLRSSAAAEVDAMCVGFLPSAVAVIAWMVEVWDGDPLTACRGGGRRMYGGVPTTG